jgi:transposase
MAKRLTEREIERIRFLQGRGKSIRQIATRLGRSKCAIQQHASVKFSALGGRPKLLSEREERLLIRDVSTGKLENAAAAARHLSETRGTSVSRQTISRALQRGGLKSVAKKKKPAISLKNKKQRLAWCREHENWTIADWMRVIWSDETKIRRYNSDGLEWCWVRDPGELSERTVKQTRKFGGGGITIWGCITWEGTGFMCKIIGNLNAELYVGILRDELMQTIDYYELDPHQIIFQQDNDSKHTSKLAKDFFEESKIAVMDWPAQSPDLNPIENIWALMKKKIGKHGRPPSGILELWEIVQKQWDEISVDDCRSVIESMPRRIAAVIKSKGG